MKSFKEFLTEAKYPTADKSEWYSDANYEHSGVR